MESTGEGRPDEGAREDPLLMLVLEETFAGIWRPGRVGVLRLETEAELLLLLLLLSVERGESERSSESGSEGEIGVKRSSGAMQVGSCIVWYGFTVVGVYNGNERASAAWMLP